MIYSLSIISQNEPVYKIVCNGVEELAELVSLIADKPRFKVLLIEKEKKNEKITQNT